MGALDGVRDRFTVVSQWKVVADFDRTDRSHVSELTKPQQSQYSKVGFRL